ncbi:MAG: hypothetical protein J3R72DRAFT_214262 [Linnemannia gamsii]|nr:MAG: hypothetical protein J3R72DRAFT_214262 [Linnemannia gamsii]
MFLFFCFVSRTGRNNSNTLTNNQRNPARRIPYGRPTAPASNINNDNYSYNNGQSSNSSKSRKVDEDDFNDIEIPDEELNEDREDQDDDGFGDLQLTQEDLYDLDAFMNDNNKDINRNDRTLVKENVSTLTTKAGAGEARAKDPTAATTVNFTPARSVPTAAAPTPIGSNGEITTQQAYTAFLERIRTGQEPTITHQRSNTATYRDLVRIPDQFLFTPVAVRPRGSEPYYYDAQRKFLLEIYPDLATAPRDSQSMMENVILTHSKDTAETYNKLALEMQSPPTTPSTCQQHQQARGAGGGAGKKISYQEKTYVAISSPLHDRDYDMQDMVTAEWLNPDGMPPHTLFLRVGHPVLLLKTLGTHFQAGTRMIIRHLSNFSITAEAISGPTLTYSEPRITIIPRMKIQSPNARDLGCLFTRLQFPVKHAFALSLSDAVGKGFSGLVGVDLRSPVEKHRQLYFLLSCCLNFRRLKVYVEDGEIPGRVGKYTRNPV